MTLFEMSEAARHLYELLESGEIDEQAVLDTMESIGASEKLESYMHVIAQIQSEIGGFEQQIKRMTERKQSLEKQVDRLKGAIVEFMKASGQKSANAGTYKLTMRESKSCEIEDESVIPLEYMVEIPASFRPDKKAMLAALKNGETIRGASLKTSYSVTAK